MVTTNTFNFKSSYYMETLEWCPYTWPDVYILNFFKQTKKPVLHTGQGLSFIIKATLAKLAC